MSLCFNNYCDKLTLKDDEGKMNSSHEFNILILNKDGMKKTISYNRHDN